MDAGRLYADVVSRFATGSPGTGPEPKFEGRWTQPMTYALLAVAEARARDERSALGPRAIGWLLRNSDLDRDGRPGWGLPMAYDAFGDGVGAAGPTNPPNHPYTITTAWVIEALTAAHQAGWHTSAERRRAARLSTAVALRWAEESATDDDSGSYFWYSPHPTDAKFCPNVSAMMAGAIQAACAVGLIEDRDGRIEALVHRAVDTLVASVARQDREGPSWDYTAGVASSRPNDAIHHAYTVWGLERYRESGGPGQLPWTPANAASCRAFLQDGMAVETAGADPALPAGRARLWGLGMCLAVAARFGRPADAEAFAKAAVAYAGPNGHRIRPGSPASAVYPRHLAHLLLGVAELVRRKPGSKG